MHFIVTYSSPLSRRFCVRALTNLPFSFAFPFRLRFDSRQRFIRPKDRGLFTVLFCCVPGKQKDFVHYVLFCVCFQRLWFWLIAWNFGKHFNGQHVANMFFEVLTSTKNFLFNYSSCSWVSRDFKSIQFISFVRVRIKPQLQNVQGSSSRTQKVHGQEVNVWWRYPWLFYVTLWLSFIASKFTNEVSFIMGFPFADWRSKLTEVVSCPGFCAATIHSWISSSTKPSRRRRMETSNRFVLFRRSI